MISFTILVVPPKSIGNVISYPYSDEGRKTNA